MPDYAEMALDMKFAQGYMHAMAIVNKDPIVANYANKLSWGIAHLMELSDKKTNAVSAEKAKANGRGEDD